MKRLVLTIALALTAVAFAETAEAPKKSAPTEQAVSHRNCHRTGVRRAGRSTTVHHHVRRTKDSSDAKTTADVKGTTEAKASSSGVKGTPAK